MTLGKRGEESIVWKFAALATGGWRNDTFEFYHSSFNTTALLHIEIILNVIREAWQRGRWEDGQMINERLGQEEETTQDTLLRILRNEFLTFSTL